MIEILGRNLSASITADFDAVRSHLQENPKWAAELLQNAGEYRWRVSLARMYSSGPYGSKVVDEGPDSFVAWGITGKNAFLAYRIERESIENIHITPLAYMERTQRIAVAVTLAIILILPVLLAPLLWRVYEAQTLRASRVYLPTFCHYLAIPIHE